QLFTRSDNINFSEIGIPSVTYSLGFTDFNDELMKVYHQPSDNASTLDYAYLERFYEGFAHLLYTLSSDTERIEWRDDKP
ncbi:M28 family peptidase, partial [Nodularia spumigena]|uniref:M28 family peptidase n=1 Tax=Nodularia spumigena TaxID=70799 RepID=UPI002B212514